MDQLLMYLKCDGKTDIKQAIILQEVQQCCCRGIHINCWYQLFSQQFLHLYLDGQELQETYLICIFVLFWQILLFN